jgi:hypothetical protein
MAQTSSVDSNEARFAGLSWQIGLLVGLVTLGHALDDPNDADE